MSRLNSSTGKLQDSSGRRKAFDKLHLQGYAINEIFRRILGNSRSINPSAAFVGMICNNGICGMTGIFKEGIVFRILLTQTLPEIFLCAFTDAG